MYRLYIFLYVESIAILRYTIYDLFLCYGKKIIYIYMFFISRELFFRREKNLLSIDFKTLLNGLQINN